MAEHMSKEDTKCNLDYRPKHMKPDREEMFNHEIRMRIIYK